MLGFVFYSATWTRLAAAIGLVIAMTASIAAAGEIYPSPQILPGPLRAKVVRVLDGDSIKIRAQIWLGQEIETTVRIDGLDTAELRGKCPRERDLAYAAKNRLAELINGDSITLYNIRSDKYGGRVIAQIRGQGDADFAQVLIGEKLGRAYAGGRRQSWCANV